jgi:hypothetical protein
MQRYTQRANQFSSNYITLRQPESHEAPLYVVAPGTKQSIGFNLCILLAQILSGRENSSICSNHVAFCASVSPVFPVRRGEAKARFGLQNQAPSSVQSTRKFFSGRRVSVDPPCLLPSRQRLPSLAQSSGCLRDSHTRAASSSRRRPWPKLAPTWGCFGDGRRGSFSISLDIGDRGSGFLEDQLDAI